MHYFCIWCHISHIIWYFNKYQITFPFRLHRGLIYVILKWFCQTRCKLSRILQQSFRGVLTFESNCTWECKVGYPSWLPDSYLAATWKYKVGYPSWLPHSYLAATRKCKVSYPSWLPHSYPTATWKCTCQLHGGVKLVIAFLLMKKEYDVSLL